MVARKKMVTRTVKRSAAPKARIVPVKAIAPAPPQASRATVAATPQAPKTPPAPKPEVHSGKPKDSKDKKKKGKKSSDGNGGVRKKMVRDSFTMPAPDYALIAILKTRTLAAGTSVKKSELLRGGLVALAAMPPAQLIELISALPAIKTGRPGKNKK